MQWNADLPDSLTWNADAVGMLLFQHRIQSRYQLAKCLGISRNTVNAAFDENWYGRATDRMIAAMCARFKVPISRIVNEPAVVIGRTNNGTRQAGRDR